jgi:hypothetical protein
MSIRALGFCLCALSALAVPGTAQARQPVRLPADCLRLSTEPAVAQWSG